MKPTEMAIGMKREMNPMRAKARMTNTMPSVSARAEDSASKLAVLVATSAPMRVAEMAAVDDVGLTTSCRDVPRRA